MYREILWTEDNEEHIAKHGVGSGQVEKVVNGRPVLTRRGREGTTEVYGATFDGRALVVILAPAWDGRWYVVTARDMTTSERRAFHRKGR
ncbi:MAG: hypothetical protein ACT4NY_29685 [Pseudonocardiales bacterium]